MPKATGTRESLLPPGLVALLARPVSPRALRVVELVLVLWTATWIVVGVITARQVLALRDLSRTVESAGVAIRSTGSTLGQLRGLPLVGPDLHRLANQARETGRRAIISGHESRRSVRRLAYLLGFAVAAVPTLPPLLLYLPLRRSWYRRRRGADGRVSPR